eukprot:scaffold59015_cov31-Tisochrysis_lutea.AAC.1
MPLAIVLDEAEGDEFPAHSGRCVCREPSPPSPTPPRRYGPVHYAILFNILDGHPAFSAALWHPPLLSDAAETSIPFPV